MSDSVQRRLEKELGTMSPSPTKRSHATSTAPTRRSHMAATTKKKRSAAAQKAARTRKKNHAARVAAGKKGARTRKRNARSPRAHKSKSHRAHSWPGQPRRHSKAAKKGWGKRRSSPKKKRHSPKGHIVAHRAFKPKPGRLYFPDKQGNIRESKMKWAR